MQNNETNYTITKTQLLQELELALKDYFVAKTHSDDEKIRIEFLNGQKFEVFITETK